MGCAPREVARVLAVPVVMNAGLCDVNDIDAFHDGPNAERIDVFIFGRVAEKLPGAPASRPQCVAALANSKKSQ
jgi:hypothetical protein